MGSSSNSKKDKRAATKAQAEEEQVPKSRFFVEVSRKNSTPPLTKEKKEKKGKEVQDIYIESLAPGTPKKFSSSRSSSKLRGSSTNEINMVVIYAKWNKLPIPVKLSNLAERLRTSVLPAKCNDDLLEKDGMDSLKQSLIEESQKIEIVKKENFFNEEVTEEEKEIIAQRVALQQRQFAAYERREHVRKSIKILKMFDYICDEEIVELLKDCNHDEDEVIYRLTKPNYLNGIRKTIALKYAKEEESYAPLMTHEQRVAYEQLLKKRSVTLRKTTNDQAKKQYRMCGRLGLDEALEQIQNNQVDPEKAFEGWSEARIKAYRMIDQNPNSYYYRFNAPGEVQRRGQWDEPEKKMFFDRLAEVGANGQWGIFSMTIPGRVGYQCSNFYRLLVETKVISDPNYVLDERGKAHYLFDKKSANGQTTKTFRTHSKHSSGLIEPLNDDQPSTSSSAAATASKSSIPQANTNAPARSSSSRRVKKATTTKEEGSTAAAALSESTNTAESSSKGSSSSSRRQQTQQKGGNTAPNKRRRRPVRRYSGGGSDSDDQDDELYDDDFSGSYSTRAGRRSRESEDDDYTSSSGQRKSKRARRPTAAAIESGLVIVGSSYNDEEEEEDEVDPSCPLPGFIDPITLEQVVKPAISKYGHVMGYDSWTRCLQNWEGKQNICPLTKKPLTKRDLVVLTFDNLDEYKDKIVNM